MKPRYRSQHGTRARIHQASRSHSKELCQKWTQDWKTLVLQSQLGFRPKTALHYNSTWGCVGGLFSGTGETVEYNPGSRLILKDFTTLLSVSLVSKRARCTQTYRADHRCANNMILDILHADDTQSFLFNLFGNKCVHQPNTCFTLFPDKMDFTTSSTGLDHFYSCKK